jgi:hypothetical protein
MMSGTRSKDARHSAQRGTRLALVSSLSQIRHPEGKNTLTTTSLISPSQPRPALGQPRTPRRPAAAMPLDELPSATRQNSTLFHVLIKEGRYAEVIELSGLVL